VYQLINGLKEETNAYRNNCDVLSLFMLNFDGFIGISIGEKFWDFEKNKPKRNCPNKWGAA